MAPSVQHYIATTARASVNWQALLAPSIVDACHTLSAIAYHKERSALVSQDPPDSHCSGSARVRMTLRSCGRHQFVPGSLAASCRKLAPPTPSRSPYTRQSSFHCPAHTGTMASGYGLNGGMSAPPHSTPLNVSHNTNTPPRHPPMT